MRRLWLALAIVQGALGLRVVARLLMTGWGMRIERSDVPADPTRRAVVLVPVLNESTRLRPCLEGLIAQGEETAEIIVIDGGSTDATAELVREFAVRDPRLRLIDAGPAPAGVNGKAWGLQVGLDQSCPALPWIVTIDADVRPKPALVRSLIALANAEGDAVVSAATTQRLSGAGEAVLHPALLATLVYRFGIPGRATIDRGRVQANGQCCLIRRDALLAAGGFAAVLDSVCEDVTLARAIAAMGQPVGLYETDDLVGVEMYASWREAWANWTRSLPMADRFTKGRMPGLADLIFVQSAPLLIAPFSAWRLGRRHPLAVVNGALLACRFGVQAGMARAYETRPWSYWLSPLVDAPAVARIWLMSRRKRHSWRGRPLTVGAPE
jgi:dolichol-phosphate mannosyltransferase